MASAAATTAAHLRLLSSSSSLSKPLLSKPHLLALSLSRPVSFQRLAARSAASPTPSTSSPSPSPAVDPAQLPPALRDIIALFQSVPDERTRYKQLLAYAARLPPMDPALKTDANRVRGCVSQVWVHAAPELDAPGCVSFQADSDAQLTKGLAALLVLGLSGAPARDVAMVPVEFIEMLGIRQSLSPSRNSGLLNMINLMKLKALQIAAGEEATDSQETHQQPAETPAVQKEEPQFAAFDTQKMPENSEAETPEEDQFQEEEPATIVEGNGSIGGGRKERIRHNLERGLSPVELNVEDISYQHKGHAGVAGSDGETHFNVRVVSEEFEGKSMLKRHRAVYDLLQDELKTGLHALSIDAKTPSEV
ncbi:sufE-like protein 1, chloroplastic/mitochondrial [Lolium perenne]|uniref:sufE-like protein 1, chloroplastic/mitochondrial n=1 Tax=Lolium perenne TaxID=4522 RepID=UPI0021EAE2A3|nr:sufE-like protein 1, chloroplastic/mitochondrial [Lolium perenne]